MFSKLFKKRLSIKADAPSQKLPDRYSFMPEEEQLQFQDDVTKFFQSKYPEFIINFAEGYVQGSDGTQYGLDNIAQQYAHASKYTKVSAKEKVKIVADHFTVMIEGRQKDKDILLNVENFEKIKKYLAVRIYPPDYINQIKDKAVYKEEIEGVLTVLALDLPSSVIFVKPDQAKVWKKKDGELFALGLKNTFANNKVEVNQNKIGENATLWSIGSDNLFATTFIYNLSKYPQLLGKFGSIVSAPHRHALLVLPIRNKSIIVAMKHFMLITKRMFTEGPGSISPNMYWYHDGKMMKLPYTIDDNGVNFAPPNEFIEVLNKVAEIE